MTSLPAVNLLDLAAAALSATIVAADIIKELSKIHSGTQTDGKNVRLKDDGSFVTDADLAAQGIIVHTLRNVSTDVRIVGEESAEDMARHNMTGIEEFDEAMFRLAQQEIHIRYNRSNDPLPLAQTSASNGYVSMTANEERGETSAASEEISSSLPQSDYVVQPSRVSVFIDPLDGTNAYARGDYDPVSILIAIILDHRPCFGVICKPFGYRGQTSILDTGCVSIYGGTLLDGVYTAGGKGSAIPEPPHGSDEESLPRAVISGSRNEGIVQDFCAHLGSKGMIHAEPLLVSGAGEKSLRIILRAENEGLWFFPKSGTSLWDVAASDALLRVSGGKLTDKFGREMDYYKSRIEAENEDGVIACFDSKLHEECIRLFHEGTWNQDQ
jgi:3'-phosphoadenosine 5'-phosphosulfate (PAPS) 3'-phosphatase